MSRVAVISDIHADRAKLEAVLDGIDRAGAEQIWCLGDFASGGPDPLACYEMVIRHCSIVLGGNHELFVAGQVWNQSRESWATLARQAYVELGQERVQELMALPSLVDGPHLQLTHASLRDPLWEFINSQEIADAQFAIMERDYLLFGHTHTQSLWQAGRSASIKRGQKIELPARALINPGAVAARGHWALLEMEGQRPTYCTWMQSL